ncbi:hypothetical protein DFH06DRAFT_1137621 [Mycena polygramma]|nr:hypothetical protein DFH06DRAFT_1137621 [Mycena polygramma]
MTLICLALHKPERARGQSILTQMLDPRAVDARQADPDARSSMVKAPSASAHTFSLPYRTNAFARSWSLSLALRLKGRALSVTSRRVGDGKDGGGRWTVDGGPGLRVRISPPRNAHPPLRVVVIRRAPGRLGRRGSACASPARDDARSSIIARGSGAHRVHARDRVEVDTNGWSMAGWRRCISVRMVSVYPSGSPWRAIRAGRCWLFNATAASLRTSANHARISLWEGSRIDQESPRSSQSKRYRSEPRNECPVRGVGNRAAFLSVGLENGLDRGLEVHELRALISSGNANAVETRRRVHDVGGPLDLPSWSASSVHVGPADEKAAVPIVEATPTSRGIRFQSSGAVLWYNDATATRPKTRRTRRVRCESRAVV